MASLWEFVQEKNEPKLRPHEKPFKKLDLEGLRKRKKEIQELANEAVFNDARTFENCLLKMVEIQEHIDFWEAIEYRSKCK